MSLELPVKESAGVWLGVLGLDWLVFGRANLILAFVLAFAVGFLIFVLRRRKRRREM
jgi:Flp pilus assembly protein TadB